MTPERWAQLGDQDRYTWFRPEQALDEWRPCFEVTRNGDFQ